MASVVENIQFVSAVWPILQDQIDEQRQLAVHELELEDVPIRWNEHGQLQVTRTELEHVVAVFGTQPEPRSPSAQLRSWLTGIPIVVVEPEALRPHL